MSRVATSVPHTAALRVSIQGEDHQHFSSRWCGMRGCGDRARAVAYRRRRRIQAE